jgi:hypothetical protein
MRNGVMSNAVMTIRVLEYSGALRRTRSMHNLDQYAPCTTTNMHIINLPRFLRNLIQYMTYYSTCRITVPVPTTCRLFEDIELHNFRQQTSHGAAGVVAPAADGFF